VDVKLAVRLALAPLLHLLVWQHSLGPCLAEPFDVDRYVATHIDMYLHGVSRTPAPESTHA
jgi:hypothetical protein